VPRFPRSVNVALGVPEARGHVLRFQALLQCRRMTQVIRLRKWQKEALDRFLTAERPDFLAVATPGSGKTTFALTSARHHLASSPQSRIVVVVPTQHLKHQWASAAVGFDLHLDPEWKSSDQSLPSDMHGIVTTYQQVAVSSDILSRLTTDAFIILDEVHHAGDERAWGDGVAKAFAPACRRLSLSGTPFRSDTRAIPFVNYEYDEAVPDYEYGYGEALADRNVVRPIHFPRIDGHMEWTAPDGSFHSFGFSDALDVTRANQRLRTALSLEGQWMPSVLTRAHQHLRQIRTEHPEAGGLVISMDVEHARGIAEYLERRHSARVVVATSDDPTASRRIARYAAGTDEWIVAVRMVSEGVDIPRLRVGVFATNTNTELFFRQAIGRLVRHMKGVKKQHAYLYIPDDPRLRTKAAQVAQQRRHSLHKEARETDPEVESQELDLGEAEERVSQFSVISAVALEADETEESVEAHADSGEDVETGYEIELTPAPIVGDGRSTGTLTRAEFKADLRSQNVEKVRELVALTGLSHAAVNKELNKRSGVTKVTQATTAQLERRLRNANHWLATLTGSVKR
jgi:superfamily II DNA or RNA helicase